MEQLIFREPATLKNTILGLKEVFDNRIPQDDNKMFDNEQPIRVVVENEYGVKHSVDGILSVTIQGDNPPEIVFSKIRGDICIVKAPLSPIVTLDHIIIKENKNGQDGGTAEGAGQDLSRLS